MSEDYEIYIERYRKGEELREAGKRCPLCRYYELYPVPGKGRAKGFCTREKEAHPDKPQWWGKGANFICPDFEE